MSIIDTSFLQNCLDSLERSYKAYQKATKTHHDDTEMYRNSVVKAFEYTLEICGKLLRKRLTPFFATKREIDALTFNDVFREAHHHGLLDQKTVKRWGQYRENRNNTSHEYNYEAAEQTLKDIPIFIKDVNALKKIIEHA